MDAPVHVIRDGQITCEAPPGSTCRMGCPDRACEEWSGDSCEHGSLTDQHCHAAEWINAVGLTDTSPGVDLDDPEAYEGLVEVEWDDGYRWCPPGFWVDYRARQPEAMRACGQLAIEGA
jgi:hypothetical protein